MESESSKDILEEELEKLNEPLKKLPRPLKWEIEKNSLDSADNEGEESGEALGDERPEYRFRRSDTLTWWTIMSHNSEQN